MTRAALFIALAACNSDKPSEPTRKPGAGDVITGTLAVDGQPQTMLACNAGHSPHVFVEVLTTSGRLRFEEQVLYWTTDTAATDRGDPLACEQLDRSWGGGTRMDGTSYFRGTLVFRCTRGKMPFIGDMTIDCGNITAGEREGLDRNRREYLEERQRAGSGSSH